MHLFLCVHASHGKEFTPLYLFCQGHSSYSESLWSHGTFNQSSRPSPVCQGCTDCQYGANVNQLGEPARKKDKAKKEESDECYHRSYVVHTKQGHYYQGMMDVLHTCFEVCFDRFFTDRPHWLRAFQQHIHSTYFLSQINNNMFSSVRILPSLVGFWYVYVELMFLCLHHYIFILLHYPSPHRRGLTPIPGDIGREVGYTDKSPVHHRADT